MNDQIDENPSPKENSNDRKAGNEDFSQSEKRPSCIAESGEGDSNFLASSATNPAKSDVSSVKKKSVKRNYLYNLIYQIFAIITPLVVTPYTSRILENDGVGQISYVSSISTYFTLFAGLGFGAYAIRTIAKCLGDKEKSSRTFWEIIIVRFLSTACSLLVYAILWLTGVFAAYQELFLIYSITVVAVAFDVSFMLQANEDFGPMALLNIVVRGASIACIFLFVKTKNDLWIYALINASSSLFSAFAIIPFLKKYLVKISFSSLRPFRHLKPAFRLFVPTIAVSVYTVLDRSMIGLLVPGDVTVVVNGVETVKSAADVESGYYQQAEKISKIMLTIITALGTVMVPRNSAYFENGDVQAVKENVYKASHLVFFIGLPMMLGLIATAQNFCPWFFGDGYEKVPYLLMILSCLIVIIGLSNVLGTQYLIPASRDKLFTISVTAGAVINFCLNSVLIPFFFSYGAAIGSVIAEACVSLIQIIVLRKEFNWKKFFFGSWRCWISSGVMFGAVYATSLFLPSSILNTFLLVFEGIAIYLCLVLVLREPMLAAFLKEIKRKFKKGKNRV